MKRIILGVVLGLFALGAAAQSPNDVVREAADLLDHQITDRKQELAADKQALHEMIDQILLPRFDRKFAAQQVLKRHWRSASAEQRQRFIDAFYSSLVKKYAEGVLEFDQSRIQILPFRGDLSKRYVTVKTIVRLDDGTKVPVNYTMIKRDTGWLIFDVVIEGISYVRTFSTEINAEIRRGGLDAVIERLEGEAGGSVAAE